MATFPKNLGGLLLEWPERAIQRADLLKLPHLEFQTKLSDPGWELFRFQSTEALHGEDTKLIQPPFHYSVVCRRSGRRALVLSANREIVEHILTTGLNQVFIPPLQRVFIAVDKLVKDLTSHPMAYVLSFAHARVPAFGTSLRAVSYYGDDLAEASMFREQLSQSIFFTCGLKEAHGGSEIVRLNRDAGVSFVFGSGKRFK